MLNFLNTIIYSYINANRLKHYNILIINFFLIQTFHNLKILREKKLYFEEIKSEKENLIKTV